MELKGSKTEQNLMTAFAGESQARNKYTYFASKAKKDGYEQIAAIFEETANNEKEHAKMWFKELHGGAVPSTIDNLMLLMVKTMNGLICIRVLQKLLEMKALLELLFYLKKWLKSKKNMKKDIENLFLILMKV